MHALHETETRPPVRTAALATLFVVTCCCPSPALAASAGRGACSADAVLGRAARLYRNARLRVEKVRYEVRVPGAPVHKEELEYGFGERGETYLRMPQGYLLVIREGRLFGFEGPRADVYVERPIVDGRVQAAVDAAFAGTGPPLVPVPVLLRMASSPQARVEAFASKFMPSLSVTGCAAAKDGRGGALQRVSFQGPNGKGSADFGAESGLLRQLDLEIVPAPGATPIEARAQFEVMAGAHYPALPGPAHGAVAVSTFAEIDKGGATPGTQVPDARLLTLDGSVVRLGEWHGSVLVLEFWASWCAPCRLTVPIVNGLADWARQSRLPVRVLSINTLEGFTSAAQARSRLAPYLAEVGNALPVLLDLGGSFHNELGSGLPLIVVVDGAGRIVASYSGLEENLAERLRARVAGLVSPPPPGPSAAAPAGPTPPRRR